MWVEEDSKISPRVGCGTRTPTPAAPRTRLTCGTHARGGGRGEGSGGVQSALSNTCDMLTDLQSGTLRKVDDAVDLLDRVRSPRGGDWRSGGASQQAYKREQVPAGRAGGGEAAWTESTTPSFARGQENATSNSVVLMVVKR